MQERIIFLGEPNVITLRIQSDDGICLQLRSQPRTDRGLFQGRHAVQLRSCIANRPQTATSGLLLEFLGQNTLNIPPLAIHAVPNGEKAVEAAVI